MSQRLKYLIPLTGFLLTSHLFAMSIGTSGQSQRPPAPPGTDIFVVDLMDHSGQLHPGTPRNITNRPGYDNQPRFLPDGRSLFYTSIRDDGQADIYRYDLGSGVSVRVIETSESEYSPTVMPDGKFFSVVRVEADSTQRLWKFPLGGGQPSLVLETIKPVGYHAWVDEKTVVLFVLGTPNTLQIVDTTTEKAETVSTSVGRSIHKVPGQEKISFVHKLSAEEWIVKELDLKTRQINSIITTLPGSEDYVWLPGGTLLMGKGTKLYRYHPARDQAWQEVADFAKDGLHGITRLAVSPNGDKIALVVNETQ